MKRAILMGIFALMISFAFVSGVMDETHHCYVSVEDGAGGGSDSETRGRDGFEVDDRSGTIGTISRDQEEVT